MTVPATPPNFTGYKPNFTLRGGNLPVPYRPPGLPMVQPGTGFGLKGLPYHPGLSVPPGSVPYTSGLPAVIPEAAAALGGEGAMASAAAQEVAKRGLLARILTSLGPYALAGLPLAAIANDPGSLPEEDDPLAAALNPSPDETGFTSILKGMTRGTAKAGMDINEGLGSIKDFFTKSRAEREMLKEMETEKAQGPLAVEALSSQPSMEDALGLARPGIKGGYAPVVLEGQGNQNQILDALLQNFISNKPGKAGEDASLKGDLLLAGISQGILESSGKNLNPVARALLGAGAGAEMASIQYKQGKAGAEAKASEAQRAWAKDAAGLGINVESEKRLQQDSRKVKVHATKKGVLIEQSLFGKDGKPYTVLQPLDMGEEASGALDPKGKVSLMGRSFTNLNKDPLGKEKMLLSQLESSGELISVMGELKDEMAKADQEAMAAVGGAASSSSALDKMKWDARRAVLLKNMVEDPKFRQQLVNRMARLRSRTGTPASPTYDGSSAFEPDWLTQITE